MPSIAATGPDLLRFKPAANLTEEGTRRSQFPRPGETDLLDGLLDKFSGHGLPSIGRGAVGVPALNCLLLAPRPETGHDHRVLQRLRGEETAVQRGVRE
ncbi:hypothetical protein [Streptomyces sp. NPDC054834]